MDEEKSADAEQLKEKYEISFLVKEGDDPEVITPILEKRDATITERAKHGLRKLAFKIKKLDQAELHTFYFTAPKEKIVKIERDLKLSGAVLRFLIVKEVQKPAPAPVRDMARAKAQQEERASKANKGEETVKAAKEKATKPKEKVEKITAEELDEKLKELTQE